MPVSGSKPVGTCAMAGRCAAMLLAALAAAPPPAAAFLHPVASELCRTQAVSSGIAANMASGAPAGVLREQLTARAAALRAC